MSCPGNFTTTFFFLLLLLGLAVQAHAGVRGEKAMERRLTNVFETTAEMPLILEAKKKKNSSVAPSDSMSPSGTPSLAPSESMNPSDVPSLGPSDVPSSSPSSATTSSPSASPSQAPSLSPSDLPSLSPSQFPSLSPTPEPTPEPTPFGATPATVASPTDATTGATTVATTGATTVATTVATTAATSMPPSQASNVPSVSPSDAARSCEYNAFEQDDLETICRLFHVFDNMGRYENNDRSIVGFEWVDLCDDMEPLNPWLCPSDGVVQEGICSHKRPHLNPAIRLHYCGPLLESLANETLRESCETWCTNYVSQDRGDCCDITCEP